MQEKFEKSGGTLFALCLLTVFAFVVNAGISIKGLYMDDLYLWHCFDTQSFLKFVFPVGSTRFRFIYNAAAWAELFFAGKGIGGIVYFNIILNALLAFFIFSVAKKWSLSWSCGIISGSMFLLSRMSYYQISQVYGLMETMALFMALLILYLLVEYVLADSGKHDGFFFASLALYSAVVFVHERYMVLWPLLVMSLLIKHSRDKRKWAGTFLSIIIVQLVRTLATGSFLPAGTGHTQVASTVTLSGVAKHCLMQSAYLLGINAGPEYLNGENFRDTPLYVFFLIILADVCLLFIAALFAYTFFKNREKAAREKWAVVIFVCFVCGCILSSSVTVRVEMRWVYVSLAAMLAGISWCVGFIARREDSRVWIMPPSAAARIFFAVYLVSMFFAELHFRGCYDRLYYWQDQARFNTLAEETYGRYGHELTEKRVYILEDGTELDDYTTDTFFAALAGKDREKDIEVHRIDDIRDIGLVEDDMVIIQEDHSQNAYLDVTAAVKNAKCRRIYGAYEDGWIDEHAKLQVMAGKTGQIELDFYYPGDEQAEQWVTVTVDGSEKLYVQLEGGKAHAVVNAGAFDTVSLEFEENFFCREATEKRGEENMAVVLNIHAD